MHQSELPTRTKQYYQYKFLDEHALIRITNTSNSITNTTSFINTHQAILPTSTNQYYQHPPNNITNKHQTVLLTPTKQYYQHPPNRITTIRQYYQCQPPRTTPHPQCNFRDTTNWKKFKKYNSHNKRVPKIDK